MSLEKSKLDVLAMSPDWKPLFAHIVIEPSDRWRSGGSLCAVPLEWIGKRAGDIPTTVYRQYDTVVEGSDGLPALKADSDDEEAVPKPFPTPNVPARFVNANNTGLTLKDSGARREWSTGANRDVASGKGRFDLLPLFALEQLAKLYEAGCIKYGDRNWEKGIPLSVYADSGFRHLTRFVRGERDEDHLLAACWNLMCLLDTRERLKLGLFDEVKSKELDNLPKPLEERIADATNKSKA